MKPTQSNKAKWKKLREKRVMGRVTLDSTKIRQVCQCSSSNVQLDESMAKQGKIVADNFIALGKSWKIYSEIKRNRKGKLYSSEIGIDTYTQHTHTYARTYIQRNRARQRKKHT